MTDLMREPVQERGVFPANAQATIRMLVPESLNCFRSSVLYYGHVSYELFHTSPGGSHVNYRWFRGFGPANAKILHPSQMNSPGLWRILRVTQHNFPPLWPRVSETHSNAFILRLKLVTGQLRWQADLSDAALGFFEVN